MKWNSYMQIFLEIYISSDENLLMWVTDALKVNHGYLLAQKPLFQKGASFLSHTFVRIP